MKRRHVIAGLLWLPAVVSWADNYPNRPIRMVVPFSAGGSTDTLARQLGNQLSKGLGQPVLIDNRAGAGGTIGTEYVAKAAGDGYTLLFVPGAHTINPSIYPKLGYDTLKDFAPIAKIASVASMTVVHPSVPVTSINELVALSKAQPGQLNFASAGSGTVTHMTGELFKAMSGADLRHVPYKGSSPALNDLLGGQVQVMFANFPGTLQYVQSGRLRVLAVNGSMRSKLLPQTPTVAESGVPGFEANSWYGVFVPTGTPSAVIDRLNREIRRALQDPDLRSMIVSEGGEPEATSPEAFGAFVREDLVKWSNVVKQTGASTR